MQQYKVNLCDSSSQELRLNKNSQLIFELSTTQYPHQDFPVSCGCVLQSKDVISGMEHIRFTDNTALTAARNGGIFTIQYCDFLASCKNETIVNDRNNTIEQAYYIKYAVWQFSRFGNYPTQSGRHDITGATGISGMM